MSPLILNVLAYGIQSVNLIGIFGKGMDNVPVSYLFEPLLDILNFNKKNFLASETSSNTSSNLSSVVLARQQELPFSYDTETGAGPSMAQADWNNNNNRFEFVF